MTADIEKLMTVDIERAVLGAILLEPSTLATVKESGLEGPMLQDESHRLIYGACLRIADDGGNPDLLTATERLRREGVLHEVGGAIYLSSLVDALPDVANVAHYTGLVIKEHHHRQLVRLMHRLEQHPDDTTASNRLAEMLITGPMRCPQLRTIELCDFLDMALPARPVLLDPWLQQGVLAMTHAWRGVGKTYFGLGVGVAVAAGRTYLGWTAPEPRGVLYVDGEMPACVMQDRLRLSVQAIGTPVAPFRLLTPDLQPYGIPFLHTPTGQAAIESLLGDDIALLIIDNLSCLTSGPENEAEGWQLMQEFMLRLRRRGLAVLVLHHSGKSGAQRGTSRREDVLDVVLQLRHPNGYSPEDGARFEVRFEKARGLHGDDLQEIEAHLITGSDETAEWSARSLDAARYEQVAAMLDDGMSQADIARELGLARSSVSRAAKRAQEKGLLGKSK